MIAPARRVLLGLAMVAMSACVSAPRTGAKPPALPPMTAPVIPASLKTTADVRDRHAQAWAKLQAGDLRGASRDYAECLRLSASFYPAESGLGLVALANHDFKGAAGHFQASLNQDARYVPALRGLVDAELGAGNTDEAIAVLERLLGLDASQDADRSRLEVLRLRQLQSLVDRAGRARDAGQLAEADRLLNQALVMSPRSAIVLRELARVETKAGQLDQAETHARQAIDLDSTDASAYAALAAVLDARGKTREAASALAQAAAIDPVWRERAAAAQARADDAGVSAEMRDLRAQPNLTRAQLAALVGTRLPALLAAAPRKAPVVATDVSGHWAATWIITVTQAGVMDVFANHTFQPGGTVRRVDLAQVASALVVLALSGKPDQLSRWQAARPVFSDLDAANLLYPAAALAVSSGTMTAAGGRFEPTRSATGAEALEAIARIEQLAGRGSR